MTIEELRQLEKAATPGPWSRLISNYDNGTMFLTNDPTGEQAVVADWLNDRDAVFLERLRNVAPLLLDVVEAVRDEGHGPKMLDRHPYCPLCKVLAALEVTP